MIDLKEIRERVERASDEGFGLEQFEDLETLLALIDQQQAEIERLRRERDQAVEDLKIMALAMRESEELSEGCCFACICEAGNLPDNCILPYGECPGYETDNCFEWRGLKEAQNAETPIN